MDSDSEDEGLSAKCLLCNAPCSATSAAYSQAVGLPAFDRLCGLCESGGLFKPLPGHEQFFLRVRTISGRVEVAGPNTHFICEGHLKTFGGRLCLVIGADKWTLKGLLAAREAATLAALRPIASNTKSVLRSSYCWGRGSMSEEGAVGPPETCPVFLSICAEEDTLARVQALDGKRVKCALRAGGAVILKELEPACTVWFLDSFWPIEEPPPPRVDWLSVRRALA